MSISIVTFATTGKNYRYRDYSNFLDELRTELSKLGFDLLSYNQTDIAPTNFKSIKPFTKMRRGAGYWVWKPFIIKTAAAQIQTRYLLYVDVDLRVENINQEQLIASLNQQAVGVFEMKDKVSDWSSDRSLQYFDKNLIADSFSYASGVILLDTEHVDFENWLRIWESYLLNPKLILDPLFTTKQNHRHDQTILSSLIAIGRLSISKLPPTSLVLDGSNETTHRNDWGGTVLRHGRLERPVDDKRSRNQISVIFHKAQLVMFWIRFSVVNLKKKIAE